MAMTDKQRRDLVDIQTRFMAEHSAKFKKGAAEHKTDLLSDYDARILLGFVKEEVLDLVSYVYALERYLDGQ